MSIEIISELVSGDTGVWGYDGVDEKENTTAELGGRKHNLSVLRGPNEWSGILERKDPCNLSLIHRHIVRRSSTSTISNPLEAGGSVQAEVSIKWGGKDEESSWSGGVSGEVHDEKGNYAKIDVKQNSNGSGSATVAAGHKEE